MTRLAKSERCPIHRRRDCCGRNPGKTLAFTRGITRKGPVTRIEDPNHERGYRELCAPPEMKRRLILKLHAQNGKCGICGKSIEDFRDCVPDHIEPRGMGAAFRDDHLENIQAAHRSCNLEKGSRRI